MALGTKRSASLFAANAEKRDALEFHDSPELDVVPVVVDNTPQRTLNTDASTVGRAHNLFFTPETEGKDFGSVLQEVQEYISGSYSSLISQGGEDAKEQLQRYITKYLQDQRIAVAGMTQTELADAIYAGMQIDKKRRRRLQEKRMAMGHKADDHEDRGLTQQTQ